MEGKKLSKKEKDKAYKANKFYDDHVAGKFNKAEGEMNFILGGKNKLKLSSSSTPKKCNTCDLETYLQKNTACFICSKCNTLNLV